MITDMHPTRHDSFVFPIPRYIDIQAALAHLESIIYDPHQLQPELEDENEHRQSTDDTAETKEQSETKAE
jgi:hypothetical protein